MEVSLQAQEARWHFHLTLSNIRSARSNLDEGSIRLRPAQLQDFAAVPNLRL